MDNLYERVETINAITSSAVRIIMSIGLAALLAAPLVAVLKEKD